MKNIIILIIVILAAWFILRFVIGGSEDDWICVDGQWIEHGVPSAPKPTTGCGEDVVINDFKECLAAGYPAMESYPRQCQDDNGNTFVENIGNELEKTDLIRLDYPRPNQIITSPLTITGQARGYWFFEGDFPVVLIGSQGGNILVESYASTETDWMTEDFVPFSATIEFDATGNELGMLILEKDNPSGLPENADSLIIPVKF